MLAVGLLTAPIGPLSTAIQVDLGLSTMGMAVTLVAPYVVAAAFLVLPGYLLGRRWPTAAAAPALALMVAGSLLNSLTPAAGLIVVGQVVVGVGAGTVLGVALALVGQLGPGRSRARLVFGLALGVAAVLGPVMSSVVATMLSWRVAFLVNVPVAAVAFVGTVLSGIAMLVRRQSRPNPPAAPTTTMPLPGETQLGGPAS